MCCVLVCLFVFVRKFRCVFCCITSEVLFLCCVSSGREREGQGVAWLTALFSSHLGTRIIIRVLYDILSWQRRSAWFEEAGLGLRSSSRMLGGLPHHVLR